MPKRLPLSRSIRDAVADAIRAGRGRNQIARDFGISTGSVSNIANEYGLWFEGCTRTATAANVRQIDQWAARVEHESQLLDEYLALTTTMTANGRPTRAERRLSYALYNVTRHHNGTYR